MRAFWCILTLRCQFYSKLLCSFNLLLNGFAEMAAASALRGKSRQRPTADRYLGLAASAGREWDSAREEVDFILMLVFIWWLRFSFSFLLSCCFLTVAEPYKAIIIFKYFGAKFYQFKIALLQRCQKHFWDLYDCIDRTKNIFINYFRRMSSETK